MSQRKESGGLSWVGPACLIPLKAKAWLDLSDRKEKGEAVDSKVVIKHRNDVVRVSQLLVPADRVELAASIYGHLSDFLARLECDGSFDPGSIGVPQTVREVVKRIDQTFRSIGQRE